MRFPRLSFVALAVVLTAIGSGCERRAAHAPGARAATTTIRGTVHSPGGGVPVLAHARVIDPTTGEPTEVVVGRDGRFTLKTSVVGFAIFELTAVDHAQLRVPIVLDGAPLELGTTLGTYRAADAGPTVEVMSWAGDPESSAPTTTPMTRDASGRLSADVPTDAKQLQVQLVNFVGEGRGVDVPGAKRYAYDGGGDYRSILDAVDGKVHVEVAATQLPTGLAPKLTFAKPHGTAAQVAALGRHWPPGPTTTPADAQALWQAARASRDATVKRAATAMALSIDLRDDAALAADERALAIALLESSPLGDSVWALAPSGMAHAVEISGSPAHRATLARVIDEQLSPDAGGMLLMGELASAHQRGDQAQARVLFARLGRAPYAELGYGQMASAWNPDRKVKAGAPLPSFAGAQLVAGAGKLRSEDLRGKVVLIELWATWCGPCVEQMDELHAIHQEHAGKAAAGQPPFEILSISMDDDVALVESFRERWPMPWLHIFAGSDRERLYAAFETSVLPFTVIVDAQGNIVEAAAVLPPEQMRELLARHLKPSAAPVAGH